MKVVEEVDLEDRVIFTGYISDEEVAAYYHRAELFVLPSKYEPFGMTTLEAMACGTPAVVTKFGGIRKDLTHEHDSLLVDVSDEHNFAKAISRILSDSNERNRIGQNGLQTILDRFSWDSIARRHLEFYERYL
jgi:mannosylfructose-phosphate synthase